MNIYDYDIPVHDGYRQGSDVQFAAKWMLIATWDKVKPYLRGGKQTSKVKCRTMSVSTKMKHAKLLHGWTDIRFL